MSRTKRNYPTEIYECRRLMVCKHFDNWSMALDWVGEIGLKYKDMHIWHVYDKRLGRDKKPWNKPTKEFKQPRRQAERSRVKQAIKLEKWETMPIFPKTDQWDWT